MDKTTEANCADCFEAWAACTCDEGPVTAKQRERRMQYEFEDHIEAYLAECSPEQRARYEWENGS